jgi:hypothetical protein
MAKEGNPQALEELKALFIPHLDADHPLVNANYNQVSIALASCSRNPIFI